MTPTPELDAAALHAARWWAETHDHPQPDDRMLAAYGQVIAARAAERERADEQAVIEAAKVWRAVRRDRQISGMTHHRACKALDEAVGHLIGELDREPVPPLTEAEMEEGREVVRRAIAYNEAARGSGTTSEGDGRG